MCNLATEMAPLEVWDIETSSKTPGVLIQKHIQEFARMAESLACLVRVIGPPADCEVILADDP